MSETLRDRLFAEIDRWWLVDPHTHIDPHHPSATSLADIMGYHYYTELAHSAGLPREAIEQPGLSPREKVARLVPMLAALDNTVQVSWLIEMAQRLWGFSDDRLTPDNWESLYETAGQHMARPDWADQVLRTSRLRSVFLTNDFDDPLEGFDTSVYVPCLRTDDLTFKLADSSVRQRLAHMAGREPSDAASLRDAVGRVFEHFKAHGARACAISLPPDFSPVPVSQGDADRAYGQLLAGKADDDALRTVSCYVFWTLAGYCADFELPLDLMIGVNRRVYRSGVFQGQDLFDSRVSLIQYRQLFNGFPQVTFPISVLASVTNQELVAYSWIFPNVVAFGHWWYSNTPAYIEHDASARLEAVPRTKQIGYYSDMYKLEFALPKFAMYKRILAKILAERFVGERGWSEERALELARQTLCDNVQRIFGVDATTSGES